MGLLGAALGVAISLAAVVALNIWPLSFPFAHQIIVLTPVISFADVTTVSQSSDYADSWLLGLRYLTEKEVTWIAEYFRNGSGYSADQLEDFYRYADAALNAGGAATAKVETLARSGFGSANPGRDYVYLRASIKDPFDVLYLTRRSPSSSSGW